MQCVALSCNWGTVVTFVVPGHRRGRGVDTSKTCGCCGKINAKLGGAKTFQCSHCGYEADRDANGARNILLRYIGKRNIRG